jgi:succinate dehydrogenase/fumarate reductase flavoprotein subunit
MPLNKIADKVFDTDLLIIGAGIGGCPAAWKAAEHGLKVTLLEKSNVSRSGHAAHGIDEIQYFPRDGLNTLDVLKIFTGKKWGDRVGEGRRTNPNILYKIIDNSLWMVDELDKAGVTMRWDDGEYYWFPKSPITDYRIDLRVHWHNVKPEMARAVSKAGVNIINRTMMVDLLTHQDRVVGVTAVDTRTGEFIVVRAKAVVLATARPFRHYNCETPFPWRYKMRYHWCPASISGDGYAAAYRAGAALIGMDDKVSYHIHDDSSIVYSALGGNDGIRSRVLTWDGREVSNLPTATYDELEKKGLDPFYQSMEDLPDDFLKRVEAHCADDTMIALKLAEDRGFNYKTHRFQLAWNTPVSSGPTSGIYIDENFNTTVKGLFAIGEAGYCRVSGCASAATSGLLLGEVMDKFISGVPEPIIDESQLENQKQTALAPLAVQEGTEPMELECAIREIDENYCGMVIKSEGRLREGLRRLGSLRREFLPKLMARNPHYLLRCLEVRNLLDVAELHLQACLERKETRGAYIRYDYPERDPSRDNCLTYQALENGKPVLKKWETPEMKPEFASGGQK